MMFGLWENPRLIVIATLFGIVSGKFLYGPRQTYPGNLAGYNDRLQIDGQPQETWKTNMGDRIMFRCITGQNDYPIFVWTKDGKVGSSLPIGTYFLIYELQIFYKATPSRRCKISIDTQWKLFS